MTDPTMCCQDSTIDCIVQDSAVDCTLKEGKRKCHEMYFEAGTATDGTEPSDIMVMFPLLPL